RVDPATNTLATTFEVAQASELVSVAAGAGSIWVGDPVKATLYRLDATTGDLLAATELGPPLIGITFTEGSLWAALEDSGVVARVNLPTAQPSPTSTLPEFGTIAATVEVGESPRQFAAGAGALWVTNADDGTVSRIDLTTNEVVASIVVVPPEEFVTGVNGATQVDAIAVDDSAVWVSAINSSQLMQIDPTTNQVVERYRLPAGVHGLTAGGGALWGRSWTSNQILRIDPATGSVVASVPVEMPASAVYLADALWVQRPGEVVKIDPATNTIVARVTYADTAGDPTAPRRMMVAAAGRLWVSSDSWHEVLEIDPATATVAGTVPLPFAIDTIVVAGSDANLWACPCFGNNNEQVWQLDLAEDEWNAVQTVPFVLGIDFDGGTLWGLGSHGEVIRIDLLP
ncbi:MAG TPA: hypothetical protein VFV93_06555, partial [Thermomicrobiales bacterium]|nr:hypothetical protein [Thermomicrobiales bacterium]